MPLLACAVPSRFDPHLKQRREWVCFLDSRQLWGKDLNGVGVSPLVIIITIYFIHPNRKLKLLFDCATKNIIILSHETHTHTHS